MARVHSGRFKFLGAPVGDKEFAASFVQDKRAVEADVLFTEMAGIDDAQVTHKLFREASLRSLSLVVVGGCWWLARVCLCLVGSVVST